MKVTNKKNNQNSAPINSDEMIKLIKVILIVVVIAVIFYGITILVTKYKKKDNGKTNKKPISAVIEYDKIQMGTIFSQPKEEYYVLIEKEDSPYNDLFESYLSVYEITENALKVYKVNMDDVFNQFYVAEQSVLETSDISKFKVSDVTLIKVKNKAVIESYEGIEKVEEALKKITG